MIRKAFVMSVNAGSEAEYERRHNPIWPDLERNLKAHGVSNYSIFLNSETRQLFAYAEIEHEAKWAEIAGTQECKEWWRYMANIMPHRSDNSPEAIELREVFHLV
jgi:L-rhamnose mutarotase